MESPAPSSSRSPRSRLVIGGRLVPAQPASQMQQQQQQQQQQQEQMVADNDRAAQELRAVDCNLSALCDHIQIEGFNAGSFSDVVVIAMGVTYRLHRLILSRSSYFRNMLHGPWKEADAPTVTLQIDDDNVNSEAITMSLAYLYGHHPKLNDSNAFRVLAAASFLDLQELCAICTDFIIAELWTSNFLEYQVFAESQDYGVHGERVRKACWGYLCQSGSMELREVLPRLSSQTIYSLLTSDRLWVPSEEKRFELALYTLLAKGELHKENQQEQGLSSCELGLSASPDSSETRKQKLMDDVGNKLLVNTEVESISVPDNLKGRTSSHNNLPELLYGAQNNVSCSKSEEASTRTIVDPISEMVVPNTVNNPFSDTSAGQNSCSFPIVRDVTNTNWMVVNGSATEGPSEESSCYNLNNNIWLPVPQSRQLSSGSSSCSGMNITGWGKFGMPSPSWGPRTVGWRQGRSAEENSGLFGEELDAFINIFEGGSLLYCNMSFEALLNARKQLEGLGFPCKAVNDGLWLQMLLSHKIQEVGVDTCRNCCMTSMSCACRRPYGHSQSSNSVGYYRQEHDQNIASDNVGNAYLGDAQGEGAGTYGSVRVHVRGPIDGLAGIGRGATFVSDAAWPPTRVVFSRVPFGLGNRNNQQSLGNDESEARIDINGNLPGDGLTALVGSSQGGNVVPLHIQHGERGFVSVSTHNATTNDIPLHMLETQEDALGLGWESWDDSDISTLSLDMKTPLRQFPPFRFGVEFQDIHKLGDGQVKHSPEVFYAGSLWKVSVQAFNDEDPQGRRTLGLFLHRRKAEPIESLKKVHMYIDSREKVTARYQLICPSKRELMVFGNLKQPGTLLPKAPKGWGWRTALLFDELADLLQSGSLRIAVVVQLI